MKATRQAELKQIVAASYEMTAAHFNATRSKVAAPDFQWAANQIGSDDNIFDAGCGNGRLLDYLKINSENYLGFDQSQALINLASKQHPGFKFKVGDLSKLSVLGDFSFSVIFCSAVISHIPGRREREEIFCSFYRLSKPGGKLIISFWKMEGKYRRKLWLNWWLKLKGRHPYGWRDLIFPWKNSSGQEIITRYYYYYSRRLFKREIKSAGWKIEAIRDDGFNYWIIAVKNK